MKHSEHTWVRRAVLAIFVLGAFSTASAQSLHDKWFKVLVTANTTRVNPYTGILSPYKLQFYIYVHFEYLSPFGTRGSEYSYEVWSMHSSGYWSSNVIDSSRTSPYSENFFPDLYMRLATEKGDYFSTYLTPRIVASPLSNSFAAGGEIYAGRDINGQSLFGWLTMKGQMTPRPKWAHND